MREPMYKYSRAAQDRFFGVPEFAYLFVLFATSSEGQRYWQGRLALKRDKAFTERMRVEILALGRAAATSLQKAGGVYQRFVSSIFV